MFFSKKVFYRGMTQPLEGDLLPTSERNGRFQPADQYPLKGLHKQLNLTPKAAAIYDHRAGGVRFAGDKYHTGSPFVALTTDPDYAAKYGLYVYKITIPSGKWRKNGIDDAASFLKREAGHDSAPGGLGFATSKPEALYEGKIPSRWIEEYQRPDLNESEGHKELNIKPKANKLKANKKDRGR